MNGVALHADLAILARLAQALSPERDAITLGLCTTPYTDAAQTLELLHELCESDGVGIDDVTEAELDKLERLTSRASPAPWVASVEGRDHSSGDDVILVGDPREDDMPVTRDSGPASADDLDFVTAARNYMPRLLADCVGSGDIPECWLR